MTTRIIKLFLRLSISAGFLSAVADRFGWWRAEYSVWGNWDKFVEYTQLINPWFPGGLVAGVAAVATAAEIIFALFLLVGQDRTVCYTQRFSNAGFRTFDGILNRHKSSP